MMSYEEAIAYIHGALKGGIKLELSRMRFLLHELGDPHLQLRCIHVAGTNGKGSTVATIASVLQTAGYCTGMYISPYVQDFRERISINGQMIPKETLAQIVEELAEISARMEKTQYGAPTEFELVTAIAFVHYAREKCDAVVLEVGLGGRFDATNVILKPLVSVICSISMDHMEYLGDTLEKIAFEKAGIMKEGGTTVLYPLQEVCVMERIREIAKERKNELVIPDTGELICEKVSAAGCEFIYKGRGYTTPLLGMHQIYNALTAIEALEIVRREIGFPREAIAEGMERVSFPGRLEILSRKPVVLIDGGHNPDGVRSMVSAVRRFYGERKIYSVLGLCEDKEYPYIIGEVAQISAAVITTKADIPRALAPETIAIYAREYCKRVQASQNPVEGLKKALAMAGPEDVIICCGSLYILGDIRTYMKNQKTE